MLFLERVVRAREAEAGVLVPVVLDRGDGERGVCSGGRGVEDAEELGADLFGAGSVDDRISLVELGCAGR